MLLKQLLDGRFTCLAANSSVASEVTIWTELQDWGFQVKDLQVCLLVRGRSSNHAQHRIVIQTGFTDDVNALGTAVNVTNNAVAAAPPYPQQATGVVTALAAPYFRLGVVVSWAVASAEEYVEGALLAGGKPY